MKIYKSVPYAFVLVLLFMLAYWLVPYVDTGVRGLIAIIAFFLSGTACLIAVMEGFGKPLYEFKPRKSKKKIAKLKKELIDIVSNELKETDDKEKIIRYSDALREIDEIL